jgi:transposase
MAERHALTDAEYDRLRPLLPSSRGKRGRPYTLDHRRTLDGILWVLQTGAAWRDLPARYGDWRSVFDRFNRWRRSGVWDAVLAALQRQADAAGAIDRGLFCADGTCVRAHRCAGGASKKNSPPASRTTTPWAAAAGASAPN